MLNYHTLLNKHLNHIPEEDYKEFFEERAGIRQYEGNNPRDTAEALAFQDTIAHFSLTNHIISTTN